MILVTGGAGYIGSHFIKTLLSQKPLQEIVVVDNLSLGHPEVFEVFPSVEFVQEDIGHIDGMRQIFKRYSIHTVMHFAGSCYVGESQVEPTKYFQNNVVNSLNLFKAMQEANVRKIVFSSSCATFGNPHYLPIDETHPQQPINIYGLTKLMVEQALQGYANVDGWQFIALRYFNAAGADESGLIGEHHEPETHLIPLVLQTALGQRPAIDILGNDYDTPDGTCVRDYIHVNDLATAHCQALELLQHHDRSEVINLGTTKGMSVKEIIDECRKITGREIPVNIAPRRSGDPPILVANPAKAEKLLGWTPQYTLSQMIESAWTWEQNRRF